MGSWPSVSPETLLSNADGTITAPDGGVLVCSCPGDGLDLAVRRISTFALLASSIITALVAAQAAPWPVLLISTTWAAGATAALIFVFRRRRLHGTISIDFERGQIVQDGRGFRRTFPVEAITGVSTPLATGESAPDEPGLSPRWLLLHLSDGQRLRLGKGPAYALGPALSFLRRAGVEAPR
jgi:hypothetical protein